MHVFCNFVVVVCFAWFTTLGEDYPTTCTWFAVLNIILFFISNRVDQKHADRIRQRSALGDLFKYCCDCCSTVFLAILTTYCLGGTHVTTQWYAVQASQLVLFTKHLSAFHRNDGLRYNVLTGPGEVIMVIIIVLAIRATFGLDWFLHVYEVSLHQVLQWFDLHDIDLPPPHVLEKLDNVTELGAELMMTLYYMMYVTAVIKTLLLKKPHGWSRELFGGVRYKHFRRTRTFDACCVQKLNKQTRKKKQTNMTEEKHRSDCYILSCVLVFLCVCT